MRQSVAFGAGGVVFRAGERSNSRAGVRRASFSTIIILGEEAIMGAAK